MVPSESVETVCPGNQHHWRAWLQAHHETKQSVWLIYYKKKTGVPTLTWREAVDEALCFGWIDSTSRPIDAEKFMQLFSRRKPTSSWSKINKENVQRLIAEGRMTQAGLDAIETAKRNGSWTLLDDVEALIIPTDLEEAFGKWPAAKPNFLRWSRSDKRMILQWLMLAKRSQTRTSRITDIVESASQNLRPKPFRPTIKRPADPEE